jgi:hypothetical protein
VEADGAALSSIAGRELVTAIITHAREAAGADLPCPMCSNPMRSIGVSGVEVDVCPDDELVWLDRGELDRFRPGLRDQTLADPGPTLPGAGAGSLTLLEAILLHWD